MSQGIGIRAIIPHNRSVEIPFSRSERSTLGIEWELALADPVTGVLVPAGHRVLEEVEAEHPELSARLSKELLLNTVEVSTGVHHRVDEAVAELRDIVQLVRSTAQTHRTRLLSSGTHPFASSRREPFTQSERYSRLIDRTQWWGRSMLIYGIHVHVGVPSAQAVFPIIQGVLRYLPQLLAVSASSPYWEGEDTGYASQRTMLFQQLPTAGLPYGFQTWTEFESFLHDQEAVGALESPTENRWDVRPAPHFGTVELRICDAVPTVREVAAIAALSQSLVDALYQRHLDGTLPEPLSPWQLRENKWRAARFGADAEVITSRDNAVTPLLTSLDRLVDELAATAERLGCLNELYDASNIAHSGASAARQRAFVGTDPTPERLSALVQKLSDELEASLDDSR